jgi:virginiamycin A acetyltransferase
MSGFSTSSFFEDSFPPSSFPYAKVDPLRRCLIGNDCWIGDKVMIVSGVSIGDGAVCAAGAVVAKDVMPYEIVGGIPAKHIGWRFDEETRRRLLSLSWWNYEPSLIRDLASPDIQVFLDVSETALIGAEPFLINYQRYTPDEIG